ncbi:hypothetical protein Ancab_008746 [Ancistrocladus abbreviatus]
MGKRHLDTGDMHHRRSYADAVKGLASRIGLKHKLAEDGVWLKKCFYGELTSIDHALDLDLYQVQVDGIAISVQIQEELPRLAVDESVDGLTVSQPSMFPPPSYVANSLSEMQGKSFVLVAENKKDVGIPNTGGLSEASPSFGHVESGAGLINDSINGTDKSPGAKLDVPVSSPLPKKLNEFGGLQILGLGPHPKPQSLGLQHRQPKLEDCTQETNQQGLLSPIEQEGSITTGPQGMHGPLHPASYPVARDPRLSLDRESPKENVRQQTAMEPTRKQKTKSMAEISGSKVSTGKNGRHLLRVERKLLDARLPRSPLFTEVADSGIDPNDSQIENRNRLICKQDSQHVDKEFSPTPNQIWSFLTWIGVKGTTTTKDMVDRIKSMEQRDLKNFLEIAPVSEMDCAQVDRVIQ